MFLYSIILLIATLVNLGTSLLFPDDPMMWFRWTHKVQLLLVLIGTPFYVNNKTNFGALLAYVVIVVMNWLIVESGAGGIIWKSLSVVSGISYAATLIVILVLEKWKS